MLKHIAFLLFLIILVPDCSFADACGSNTDGCATNQWCKTTTDTESTISSCTTCTNGPIINSKPCGDSGAACQYTKSGGNSNNCEWTVTCPENQVMCSEIPCGKWNPDVQTIKGGGTTGINSASCTYTKPENLTCNNSNDECNGYHKENNKCVQNKQNCDGGFKVWENSNNAYSQCYQTCDGQSMDTLGTMCNTQYGNCYSSSGKCNIVLGSCDGTIDGDYSDGNLSVCKCTKTETTDYGKRTSTQQYSSGMGNNTKWGSATYNVTECNAGYYANSDTCEITPAGYFSPANNTTAYKCPYGATSAAGAKSVTECYFDKIKDSSGKTYTTGVNAYLSKTLICKYCKENQNLCGDVELECPESTN